VALKHVLEGITLTRQELKGKVPLIGFTGAPWTLMCYMIQGGGAGVSKSFDHVRAWLYKYPTESGELLDLLSDAVTEFLIEQAFAGAQFLEIFDSWAGDLSYELWKFFSFKRLKKIVRTVKKILRKHNYDVPISIFSKGAHFSIEDLVHTDFDVIAVDWSMDPSDCRRRLNWTDKHSYKTLQGNLDPAVLYGSKEIIEEQVQHVLKSFRHRGDMKGHIFNLGHGMLPDHTPEAVGWALDAVYHLSTTHHEEREKKISRKKTKKRCKQRRKKTKRSCTKRRKKKTT